MISDTERLIDGFRGLPAGMDGSKEPPQTPSEAAWYATNVTFRGGNGPRTRPGFREIPPTYWRNPQPVKSVSSITIADGIATVTTSANHNYDNKDKVTIAGATPSGLNGTHVITDTGNTTFTFPTSETGSVTGTITCFRDIDAAYNEDYINSTTSRVRYANDIQSAIYIQGVHIYQDPRLGNPTQMIVVADGKIMALNFNEGSVYRLNLSDEISADIPVYMTQAEKFLIIQTGQDEPRIYDGYVLRRASWYGDQTVPIGKQMAYGQGRLFVAVNEGAEIVAGDLVFGGSTTNVGITSSSAANPTVITTAANHGFAVGDQITISGHSSTPPINSTYTIGTTPAANTFTIPVAVTSAGSGGYVARFNAGQDSDLLRFTEDTFLNEGGSFAPTGKVGRVTGLAFLPVQDTATGQGDLIAFCERGAVTFQVSAPRDQWKNIEGFQRVLFDNIGSTSESILPVNGDLFFRSREGNGIRTYRNARAESQGYGQTPISAEIDPVLRQDTQWMLDQVSFTYFDNRLLMTCLPQQFPRRASDQTEADQYAAEPIPTLFNGIAVLDFDSTSAGRGKSAAVFDGVWTGLRIVKLVQGTFDGDPRCFALCLHEDDTGRRVEIWEVTKNDEYDTPVEGKRRVKSGIVTRAFDFRDAMGLKKLIRCDLWFDDLGGGVDYPFECELAYRPDDYPNFTTWQSFQRAFETEIGKDGRNIIADVANEFTDISWTKVNLSVVSNIETSPYGTRNADFLVENTSSGRKAVSIPFTPNTDGINHTFSVFVKPNGRRYVSLELFQTNSSSNVRAAVFDLQNGIVVPDLFSYDLLPATRRIPAEIVDLGNGWFRCSATLALSLIPEALSPLTGSVWVSGEGNVTLDANNFGGDIYARGTPVTPITGISPGQIIDVGGSATPSGYTITVDNAGSFVGNVYIKNDPTEWTLRLNLVEKNGNNFVSNYTGAGNLGVFVWGAQLEVGNSAGTFESSALPNFERGYAPQVRFPAPPLTANVAMKTPAVPAYLGHDFTLRVNWTGRAHLGRLMLHGQRLTEAVNGGTL